MKQIGCSFTAVQEMPDPSRADPPSLIQGPKLAFPDFRA
jgi:hypothetical protein